jgi:hypothetical protein
MTSRRRAAAGFTALAAITAALVLGGVSAANADVTVNLVDGGSYDWSAAGLVVSGTTDTPTEEVRVVDNADDTVLCTDATLGPLTWECSVFLEPRAAGYDLRVEQDTGLQELVTIFSTLPLHTVTGPANVPAGGTINLTGENGYPGAAINAVVTTPNEPGLVCNAVVGAGGTWGCNIPFDAELNPDSDATVTVTQNYGSAPSRVVNHVVHVDGTVTITAPASNGDVDWTGAPTTISGTSSDLGSTVSVFRSEGGSPDPVAGCQTLAVQPNGSWSCTAVFDVGIWDVYVQQGISNASISDYTVRIPAPTIDQNDPFYSPLDSVATFSGTTTYQGTPASYVQVYFPTPGALCADSTITWDAGTQTGSWSCSIDVLDADPPFTDGDSYTYTVRQEDSGAAPFRTASHTFVVGIAPPPTMNCAFVPAGVTISSPGQVDKGIYRLTPYTEGGGSGGSDEGGYTLGPQGYCNGDPGYQDPSVTSWNDALVQDCNTGNCVLSGLAAGIYEVYFGAGAAPSQFYDYLFRIPTTPAMTSVVSTANSVVIGGTATAGDAIRVVRSNGTSLCTTTVTGAGTWACQFPKSSAASARVIATDPQSGGLSAYSASRSIPIFEPETLVTPPVDPPLTLVSWFLEFGGDLMDLKPGDSFILNVSGMPEGTEIEVWMHSTPRLLGTASGTGLPMALALTVPEDIESGAHEIEMIGVTPLGTQYFFTSDAMVTGGVDPAATPGDEEPTEPGDEGGAGGGPVDRTDAAAPSALSESIPPLERIVANPVTIAIAGGLALALLFLVALPTELLNSSLSSNTSRLGRVYGSIDGAMSKAQDWFIKVTRSRALAAGVITVIVAIVYGFIDPGFGFDVVSLRLVLSLALAFFILSYGASWLSGFVIRRLWGTSAVIAIQPSIILFAVVGVVVARILDFSPGFLIGIAIGLELIQASRRVSARAVLVQFLFVVGLALAAWVAYSLFTPGDDFGGMLVEDTLVAVTAEGLTGALIAVFPLQFMDGRELWLDSKRLWVGAFLLVAVPFSLLVLPTAVEGTEVGDYGIWLLVFAVFGLISVTIWLVFARAAKREEERVAAEESVDA